MYLDEKIAQLDRARRQKEKQVVKEAVSEKKLTLEEALQGILAEELKLEDGTMFEFESREYSENQIPVCLFKNFFEASQEEEEGVIYVNHTHDVSQILSWPKQEIPSTTLEQWGNLLVNGMAANQMYANITKKEQLTFVEYICFEVPTGKGWLYNIVFRIRGNEHKLTGNYNCKKEDTGTFGIILEAMVLALDKWFIDRERGGLNGE